MVPAFNEEASIAKVIREIPRKINGVEEVRILIMNDGSQDETSRIAREAGADYIFENNINRGLAYTFRKGLEESLRLGADIIVNIDADSQYDPNEIGALIKPIFSENAGMVIGDRQVRKLDHMKAINKYGNVAGSWVLRRLTGANVIDASSGFRAFSRETAFALNIYFDHTYTHQTIIEAMNKKIKIAQIPIIFRRRESGESRLIKNIFTHIKTSLANIIRTILVYKPLKILSVTGLVFVSMGVLLGLRFLYYYFFTIGAGKVQSLILSAVFILFGIIIIVLGLLADLIGINRRLNEEILSKIKKMDYEKRG